MLTVLFTTAMLLCSPLPPCFHVASQAHATNRQVDRAAPIHEESQAELHRQGGSLSVAVSVRGRSSARITVSANRYAGAARSNAAAVDFLAAAIDRGYEECSATFHRPAGQVQGVCLSQWTGTTQTVLLSAERGSHEIEVVLRFRNDASLSRHADVALLTAQINAALSA